MYNIIFEGKELLLVGDLIDGGGIATEDVYLAGEESYAHLFPDGNIRRFGQVIGNVEDIKILSKANDICSPSWAGILNQRSMQ